MHLIAELEASTICGFPPRAPANPIHYTRTARQIASDLLGRAGLFIENLYHALRGRMVIYSTSESAHKLAVSRIYIKPGFEVPDGASDWYEDEAKTKPIQFQVIFENGRAEVPDSVGKWLLAQGMAKKSRLILPAVSRLIHA
jgi:hypothetical protein